MTRILHTGDTHLGYQQYHLPERRRDFQRAFELVADDAVTEGVDAVVHAGDLFHDRKPRLSDIMGALRVLRTLDDAGIPFLAVVGNHEGKRSQQWLDLFESMGLATRLGSESVLIDDVAFYGLDFVPRSKRDDLDYEYEPHDAEHAALVTHGLFEPFEHGNWDARELCREASVDFDALLVGDDHEAKQKRLAEFDAWLTYCGSTERASASERENRGYNLVSFGETVDIRRRGIDTREFRFLDAELKPGEGSERIRGRIDQHDVEDAVVIVRITGDGDQVMPAGIEEYADDQGALATRVNDQREIEDEADVDVSFADPDEAVEQRISELGLSPAARDLDETIRASKVADSNVADTVERRVGEFIEEAEPGAFTDTEDLAAAEGGESAEQSAGNGPEPGDRSADDQSQVTMEDYL